MSVVFRNILFITMIQTLKANPDKTVIEQKHENFNHTSSNSFFKKSNIDSLYPFFIGFFIFFAFCCGICVPLVCLKLNSMSSALAMKKEKEKEKINIPIPNIRMQISPRKQKEAFELKENYEEGLISGNKLNQIKQQFIIKVKVEECSTPRNRPKQNSFQQSQKKKTNTIYNKINQFSPKKLNTNINKKNSILSNETREQYNNSLCQNLRNEPNEEIATSENKINKSPALEKFRRKINDENQTTGNEFGNTPFERFRTKIDEEKQTSRNNIDQTQYLKKQRVEIEDEISILKMSMSESISSISPIELNSDDLNPSFSNSHDSNTIELEIQ